ncbi:MAG: DUF4097 domain-containing protein [Clostridiales bacterium]|nr:DUF4097 domain-containing protein [Clostridiales bacterium]
MNKFNFSFKDSEGIYTCAKQIMLDFSVCDVTIKTGEAFSIEGLNIYSQGLEYNLAGDNLSIRYKTEKKLNIMNNIRPQKLEITLPNTFYDTVTINSNVGNLDVFDINCKSLTLYGGVGDIHLTNLLVEEKTNLSTNVGNLTSNNSSYANLNFYINVGDGKFYNCKVTGDCKIKGSIGKIKMNLYGDFSDYSFKTKTSIGNAIINGQRYNNITTERKSNHFNISTNVGDIKININ